MQFSTLALAAVAVVGTNAVLNLTTTTYGGITVGTPFKVTWGDASGPVALILKSGDPNHLDTISTITAGLASPTGSYTWTPDSDLSSGNYALEIQDSVTTNYGALFQLLGATASPTTSGSPSSTAVSTTTSKVSAVTTTTTDSSTASSTGTSSTGSSTSGSSTSGSSTGSTTSSRTSSTSSTSSSASPSSSAPPSTNSAAPLSSSLAMVLLAFAAFAFTN